MRINHAAFAAQYAAFKTEQALLKQQQTAAADWAASIDREMHHVTLNALLDGLLDIPETHETVAILKRARQAVTEEARQLEETRTQHQRIEDGINHLAGMLGLTLADIDHEEWGHA
jgi:hypothetical protein